MSAAVKACNKALTIKNTRSVCNESMGPTAMLIAVPPGAKWPASALDNFTDYILQQTHAPKAQRWYILFGPEVPIRKITNNKESDVIFTADDGTQIFIRYGVLNRTFSTTEGGLCFAKALQSLNKSGYSFIEVDNASQIMARVNSDKSYSAIKTTFVYSPSIDLGDLKNPSMTNFAISIKPEEYIGNGVILQMDDDTILDLVSLLDVEVDPLGFTNTGSTRATATDTLTIGATGDTVDLKIGGVSLAAGPVTQTGTETTATLLAAKVAAAITAAVATNGGYTALNAAGILTISAPADLGATANGKTITAVITGAITQTPGGAFAGGVTGTATLKFAIQTECDEKDLIAEFGATLVNSSLVKITNSAGAVITPSSVTIVSGVGQAVIPFVADTYTVGLADTGTLFAATIEGYEETDPAVFVVS